MKTIEIAFDDFGQPHTMVHPYKIHLMIESEYENTTCLSYPTYRPTCNINSFYNAVYRDKIERVTCENCKKTEAYTYYLKYG